MFRNVCVKWGVDILVIDVKFYDVYGKIYC